MDFLVFGMTDYIYPTTPEGLPILRHSTQPYDMLSYYTRPSQTQPHQTELYQTQSYQIQSCKTQPYLRQPQAPFKGRFAAHLYALGHIAPVIRPPLESTNPNSREQHILEETGILPLFQQKYHSDKKPLFRNSQTTIIRASRIQTPPLPNKGFVIKVFKSRNRAVANARHELKGILAATQGSTTISRHEAAMYRMAQCVDHHFEGKYANMVLDYYNGGDLFSLQDRALDHNGQMPEALLWHLFVQLSEGIAWLHEGMAEASGPGKGRSIIHRDLKPENVLLDFKQKNALPLVRITDFGLFVFDEEEELYQWDSWVGTSLFWPPEAAELHRSSPEYSPNRVCGRTNTKAADIWAVGSIIQSLAAYRENLVPEIELEAQLGEEIWCTVAKREIWDLQNRQFIRQTTNIPNAEPYSPMLQSVCCGAMDIESERMTAGRLAYHVKQMMAYWNKDGPNVEMMPEWLWPDSISDFKPRRFWGKQYHHRSNEQDEPMRNDSLIEQ